MDSSKVKTWSPKNLALWGRIQSHALNFEAKLMHQTGWTKKKANQAMEQYRRFCFLACQQEVCPSKDVDTVWHLHLLYTQDYWCSFCPDVLEKVLHHHPGGASSDEELKHRKLYLLTLHAYEDWFGEVPPVECWESERDRFASHKRKSWFKKFPWFKSKISIKGER